MNSKQRVITALTRAGLPDRVPLQFDLSRSLADRFAAKYGIAPHYTTSYYEDVTYRLSNNDLRVAMGSDCVIVGAGLPRGYEHPTDENGWIINEFGMKMREGPVYMDVVVHPLANVQTAEEIAAFSFPDPLAEGRYDDAALYIEKYQHDYFIVGDMELTMFDMMQQLIGLEKLLVDMAQGAEYLEPLMDKCKDFAVAIGKKLVVLGVDADLGRRRFRRAERHADLPAHVAPLFQGALPPGLRRTEGGQPRCDHLPALRRRGGADPGRLDRRRAWRCSTRCSRTSPAMSRRT